MKETLIILFFWIITILVGWLLYLEIQQETTRLKACKNYSLSVEEYNLLCKNKK